MRAARALLAVAAMLAATLTIVVAPAGASEPEQITFSVRKICLDTGQTRVRVRVENPEKVDHDVQFSITTSKRGERLFTDYVGAKSERRIMKAINVPPGGFVRFTIGTEGDDFSSAWQRTFTPLDC